MKFLIIASYAESVVPFRGRLIEELIQAGCEVHVAAPGVSKVRETCAPMLGRGIVLHDIPLRRTSTNPFADIGLLISLFLLIRRIRPAVTMPYTAKPVIYGTLAAWMAHVPRRYVLVTGLGFAFTGKRQGGTVRVVRFLYRLALTRASKVFFQNPDDECLFRELGILPRSVASVVVNGSGVDLNRFQSAELKQGQICFLMVARLLADKGVRQYVEAARRIRACSPEVRCRLVGWIDSSPDAINQEELDEWVSEGTIEFLGKLGDVRPAIADSTVYVLPSFREGTPRTVLEAMAMGRAIITTDAPGCRETVVDGYNGYLVPVDSVDALVQSMQMFVDNPCLATTMGLRSRQIAVDRYDVRKVNAVMLREMGIPSIQARQEQIA